MERRAMSNASRHTLNSLSSRALRLFRERQNRSRLFDDDLFNDPCWNLMLACFVAETHGLTLAYYEACCAARAQHPTAGRWIETLHQAGWLSLGAGSDEDQTVSLTARGVRAMTDYLSGIASEP